MKTKVMVFTDKSRHNANEVNEVAQTVFPSDNYEVRIIDATNRNIDDLWKYEHGPILIGCGEGADYIEPIKNYKRKYLISPTVNPQCQTDEYDTENTVCLFGGDPKSHQMAEAYERIYPNIFSDVSDGCLGLMDGMDYLNALDVFMFRINQSQTK